MNFMDGATLIISDDIFYQGVLYSIKKSKECLQPLFEGFTNSLESIKLTGNLKECFINIRLYHKSGTTVEDFIFDKLVIEDNGDGFDDENFRRMNVFRDTRKGFSNKGTGRIQLLHFFDEANYKSIFKNNEGFIERSFMLSKKFLNKNAIISDKGSIEAKEKERITQLTLTKLLKEKDQYYYDKLDIDDLKKHIIDRYIMELCEKRNVLPSISISSFVDGNLKKEISIVSNDIPELDKKETIDLYYHTLSSDGKEFVKCDKKEKLHLTSFKIPDRCLEKNEIKLTSKGEIRPYPIVKLECLKAKDKIDDNRYLFLLSGDYLDQRDADIRGSLLIPTKKEFKEKNSDASDMFNEGEIFIDDITDVTNNKIINIYDKINKKSDEKNNEVETLKSMFLLDEDIINSLEINLNDTDNSILRKVYEVDAKIIAEKDAKMKKQIEELNNLLTTDDNYQEKLSIQVNEFVKAIPLQNRTALTQYVARRKLVLDLYDKILKKEIKTLKDGGRINEDLMHNLIFQQSSDNPGISDLWIIEEDFIYFKGFSENRLNMIKINGKLMFNKKFEEEENRYLNSLGEKRLTKRPDVLLFPDEGK